MKKPFLLIIFLPLFLFGTWFIAVPERLITDLLENSLGSNDLFLSAEGFEKGFFYNFSAERISLKRKSPDASDGPLLIFESIDGRLNFISLLRLAPELDFDCIMNNGRINGAVRLKGRGSIRINGDRMNISGIPFIESLGIHGDGDLAVNLLLNNGKGELKFSVDDARLVNTSLSGVFLPLEMFKNMKGIMAVNNGAVEVKSLSLEGRGVNARIKGIIKGSDMDLNMELTMDSSFESGPILMKMLEQYRISPGYYLLPIRYSLSSLHKSML